MSNKGQSATKGKSEICDYVQSRAVTYKQQESIALSYAQNTKIMSYTGQSLLRAEKIKVCLTQRQSLSGQGLCPKKKGSPRHNGKDYVQRKEKGSPYRQSTIVCSNNANIILGRNSQFNVSYLKYGSFT